MSKAMHERKKISENIFKNKNVISFIDQAQWNVNDKKIKKKIFISKVFFLFIA